MYTHPHIHVHPRTHTYTPFGYGQIQSYGIILYASKMFSDSWKEKNVQP